VIRASAHCERGEARHSERLDEQGMRRAPVTAKSTKYEAIAMSSVG